MSGGLDPGQWICGAVLLVGLLVLHLRRRMRGAPALAGRLASFGRAALAGALLMALFAALVIWVAIHLGPMP